MDGGFVSKYNTNRLLGPCRPYAVDRHLPFGDHRGYTRVLRTVSVSQSSTWCGQSIMRRLTDFTATLLCTGLWVLSDPVNMIMFYAVGGCSSAGTTPSCCSADPGPEKHNRSVGRSMHQRVFLIRLLWLLSFDTVGPYERPYRSSRVHTFGLSVAVLVPALGSRKDHYCST